MLPGAILVVGQGFPRHHWARDSWEHTIEPGMLGENPIVCLELLGQSVVDRAVQKLLHDGVKLVTVVIQEEFSQLVRTWATEGTRINSVPPQVDLWSAAECALREYVHQGVDLVLLTRLNAYVELDLGHLIRFHRATKQAVTAVEKDSEPLDSWVIEADQVRKMRRMGLPALVNREGLSGVTPYSVPGYVGRLEDATDLRRLVVDAFLSRCSLRPKGREVSPGVWFDVGVRTHRRARIEAPAYLGRGAKLRADTLVTRFSALERGCDVHDGTVIEDASVLANTYVGKGLNVAHAVVDGNKLLPLRHDIVVEIQDNRLLGRTLPIESPRSAAGSNSSASLAERFLATAWN
jgi:NDP-sugar pyrophosphorylase family protein